MKTAVRSYLHPLRIASLPLLALFLGVILTSCASQVVVLNQYDLSNFKNRDVVLMLSDSLPVMSHTKLFASFTKDGIDPATVRSRIDASFREGLLTPLHKARIRIDSIRVATGPADTVRLETDGWRLLSLHAWGGLDSNALYLRLNPIHFHSSTDHEMVMGTMQTKQNLSASMNWILYDPREGKAVMGGYAQGSSNTWALVTSIVTQRDWYAAARKCGNQIAQAIAKRR